MQRPRWSSGGAAKCGREGVRRTRRGPRWPEALHYNSLYSYSNDTRWVRPADGGRAGQSMSWGGQESKERWAAERVKRLQHCSWAAAVVLARPPGQHGKGDAAPTLQLGCRCRTKLCADAYMVWRRAVDIAVGRRSWSPRTTAAMLMCEQLNCTPSAS